MEYNYPDPNDVITYATIAQYTNTEQDYWQKSEELILDKVADYIQKSNTSKDAMLDVGCGEGRLLKRFNAIYKNMTALDPDKVRLNNIDLKALEGTVTTHNTSLSDFETKQKYDFIVCSHIIQHINTLEVEPFIAKLSSLMSRDGLLFLSTNHSTKDHDYYIKSYIENNTSIELEVEQAEFNLLTSQVGTLPIHFYHTESLISLFNKYGLEVELMRVFHEDSKAPDNQFIDDYINSTEQLQKQNGRDIAFLLKKKQTYKPSPYPLDFLSNRTSICSLTYIPLPKDKQEIIWASIKRTICENTNFPCPNREDCKSDIPSEDKEKNICNCLYHCSRFLKDVNDTTREFYNERTHLMSIDVEENSIFGLLKISYILEYFPNQDSLILLMNVYCQKQLNVDKIIKLRHFLARGGDEFNDIIDLKYHLLKQCKSKQPSQAQQREIDKNKQEILDKIRDKSDKKTPNALNNLLRRALLDIIDDAHPHHKVSHQKFDGNLIIEVDKASATEQTNQEICKQLYGIMTGDEGWRYVPQDVAIKKVFRYSWGSREFVKSYFYGTTTLVLNSKPDHYIESQRVNGKYIYGGSDPYFGIRSCIAGLDHLILEAIEKGFLTLHEIEAQLDHVKFYYKENTEQHKNNIILSLKRLMGLSSDNDLHDLNELSKIRVTMISVLNTSYSTSQELDDLTRIIFEQNGIIKRFEDLKYELTLLGEEIKFSHDKIESDILTVLTVLTVVISIVIGTFSIIDHNTNNLKVARGAVSFLDSDAGYYFYFAFVVLMMFIISGISFKRVSRKQKKK